ncbi:MAG TPA: hypothetical protein VNG90_00525 [Candidatus Acidoferrum sp.]|nr:hypothetical protein [Candidatus Acidoferrum sp.]
MFALIDRKPSGRTIVALLGAAVILGVGLVVRGASLYLNPANLSNAGIVPMAIVALAVIFAELDNRFSKRVKIIYSVGLVLYLVLLLIFVFA